MAKITPGLDFLGCNILLPGFSAFIVFAFIRRWLDLHFATWILVAVPVLVVSFHVLVRKLLTENAHAAEAARLGARLVPRGTQLDIFRILLGHLGYPNGRVWELVEKYGPVLLGNNTIITTSPQHVKIILTTDSHNYVKGESLHEAMDLVHGTGVFNSPIDTRQFHRAITRPFFNRNRATHLEIFHRHAGNVVSQMKSYMNANQPIDFLDLIRHSTLNIATNLLFGKCVSSLPYPPEANPNATFPLLPVTEFSEALLRVQDIISERERLGWVWPLYEILWDKAKVPLSIIGVNLDPIIQNAIGRKMMRGVGMAYDRYDISGGETLLDHLVELTSDSTLVKNGILNTLIAGRAGTATTLAHLVYFIVYNASVMTRLRKEILEVVGTSRIPNGDDMVNLKYLRAVINETLRLVPHVQYIKRETTTATLWPSPDPNEKRIYLPVHTKILFDISALHTSKDLWGPDANQFDPDRFLDHRYTKYLAHSPHIFLPFGAGPRTCLGKDFPYDEISVTVIELLRCFPDLTLLQPQPSPGRTAAHSVVDVSVDVSQGLKELWLTIGL